jgi:hypothetical protein
MKDKAHNSHDGHESFQKISSFSLASSRQFGGTKAFIGAGLHELDTSALGGLKRGFHG